MPELVLVGIRLGLLALLWIFVLLAIRASRTDLFGSTARAAPAAPQSSAPARGAPPARGKRRDQNRGPRRLVVTTGTLAGNSVTLGDTPVTIGRADDSTLVLTDDYASNRHARLTPRDGGWWLEDLGSTNGTFLDRTKVTDPTPVPPGAPIRIGRTTLELRR